MGLVRVALIFGLLMVAWSLIVVVTGVPDYILPPPHEVLATLWRHADLIAAAAVVTTGEIVLGLLIATVIAVSAALMLIVRPTLRRWLLPILVISQALPVFALAPLLVLWFGYGIASKVVMAMLIIFFPIMIGFYDGLRRVDGALLDLGSVMLAGSRHPHWALLRYIRIPAALPSLGSGLRIGVAVAPIGAIVGEWVGSSAGLGYLMLHASGRMQIDLMFACLFVLATITLTLYIGVDISLRRYLWWQEDRPSGTVLSRA